MRICLSICDTLDCEGNTPTMVIFTINPLYIYVYMYIWLVVSTHEGTGTYSIATLIKHNQTFRISMNAIKCLSYSHESSSMFLAAVRICRICSLDALLSQQFKLFLPFPVCAGETWKLHQLCRGWPIRAALPKMSCP